MTISEQAKAVAISLELTSSEALALAQFVKRVGFSEIRSNAVDDGEAYEMRSALAQLQRALGEAGYEPR